MRLSRWTLAVWSIAAASVGWQALHSQRTQAIQATRVPAEGTRIATRGPYPTTEREFLARDIRPIKFVERDHDEFLTAADDCDVTLACTPVEPGFTNLDRRDTPLTVQWDAKHVGALDPQIAVSSTHVIVTNTSSIAFYEKNGTLIGTRRGISGQQLKLQNPIPALSFFAPLIGPMNDTLNLQPEALARLKPDGTLFYGIDEIYDLRVMFDPYRKRFWITGLAQNDNADSDFLDQNVYRRSKFVLAVSRTENPLDGFLRYFLDAQPDDGRCWDECGCEGLDNFPGAAADYPSIGITDELVLLTVSAGQHSKLAAACLTDEQKARYAVVYVLDADDLASGAPADGFRFHRLPTPDDNPSAPAVWIRPARHHTPTPWKTLPFQPAAFLANFHGDNVVVWGLYFEPDGGPAHIVRIPVPIKPLVTPGAAPQRHSPPITVARSVAPGFGHMVMSAVYRDGRLYVTGSDCKIWEGASECAAAIRLLRLDVGLYPGLLPPVPGSGFIDRTFGQRNIFDDGPDDIVHYGWPWIEVNSEGTMVLSYNRTGETVFPEARFSIRLADAADLQPSFVLHEGSYTLGAQFKLGDKPVGKIDNSGMSIDGFDDRAIWMVQPYAYRPNPRVAAGSYRLAVGKVFGERHPDLVIEDVNVSTGRVIQDGRIQFDITLRNQGDGPAESGSVDVLLSFDRQLDRIDIVLTSADVPAIAPGGETTVHVQTEATAAPGRYYVGAIVRGVEPGPEYSSGNNASIVRNSDRLDIIRR